MFQSLFPIFILFYEFFAYLSNDMYLPALILIEQDFATTQELVQISIMVWYAGLALPQIGMGCLSDRFGRRVVLLLGGILFLLATVGLALSTNIYFFLVCRFFEGVGICSLLVSGYASIHESFDDNKAIRIIAWMGSITVMAPMLGPLAGGYFLLFFSWRAIFWVIALASAFAVGVLFFIMPETNKTASQGASYLKLLKNRQFVTSALTLGLLISVMIAWIAASPFLLMQNEGLDRFEFGLLQIPIFAGYAAATRLVGPLHERLGSEKIFKTGFGIILIALGLLVVGHYQDLSYVWKLLVPISIYSWGFGLVSAPLNRSVFTSSEEKKGVVTAMFYLIEMGTASLITLSLGMISFFSLACCVILGACLSMFLRRENSLKSFLIKS